MAVAITEQSVGMFGCKRLATTFADELKRLANRVQAGLDFLVAFPAPDALTFQLFLPLDLLRCKLRCRKVKLPDKAQVNIYPLHTVAVHLLRGMNDDFVNEFIEAKELARQDPENQP